MRGSRTLKAKSEGTSGSIDCASSTKRSSSGLPFSEPVAMQTARASIRDSEPSKVSENPPPSTGTMPVSALF